MIFFVVGKYKDEVLCNVVLMRATHLLLGHPWQFVRKVKNDRFKNRYSLENDGKTFTLISLKLRQVYESQLKLKEDGEAENTEQSYEDK